MPLPPSQKLLSYQCRFSTSTARQALPSQFPVPQGLGHWPSIQLREGTRCLGLGPGARSLSSLLGKPGDCEDGLTPLSFASFLSSFLPARSHQHANTNTLYLIFKEILSRTLALPATAAQPCCCHSHTRPKTGRPWLLLPHPLPFPLHPPPCLASAATPPTCKKITKLSLLASFLLCLQLELSRPWPDVLASLGFPAWCSPGFLPAGSSP